MSERTYFLVNDTRYDNHHGGLSVVRNLHLGMERRGWKCTGSLPVSSSVGNLGAHRRQIREARMIVVNGEGSLHHNSRNAGRLFDICNRLLETRPIALVNAVWQDNDAARWKPLLQRLSTVYARDQRSCRQLHEIGIDAGCAPDLTFYDYPVFTQGSHSGFLCTDSVLNEWTVRALRLCEHDREITFRTLYTGEMRYIRGIRDWEKVVKYRLYPGLWNSFGVKVPPRYRSLPSAITDTGDFLRNIASCKAICVARYHALCFALQQNVPFIAVSSNSHKSEALLEDVGLSPQEYLIDLAQIEHVKERLAEAAARHPAVRSMIDDFNCTAKRRIDDMLDEVTCKND